MSIGSRVAVESDADLAKRWALPLRVEAADAPLMLRVEAGRLVLAGDPALTAIHWRWISWPDGSRIDVASGAGEAS